MKQQKVNFDEWSRRAYECACSHGFHDKIFSDEHWIMQVIIEVGEMVEAHRRGRFANVEAFRKSDTVNDESFKDNFNRFIKDTMEDEMADIIIWLADYTGMKGYTMNRLVQGGPDLQGIGLLSPCSGENISESGFRIVCGLIDMVNRDEIYIASTVYYVFEAAYREGIDLPWHVEQKMRYNELRPMLNGKRY